MKNKLYEWLNCDESVIKLSIKLLKDSTHQSTYYKLNQQPFKFVELFGYLVSVELKYSKLYLHLDDGTGVVRCIQSTDTSIDYSIGDAVSITGKLDNNDYGKCIYVNSIVKHVDLNFEIDFLELVEQTFRKSHTFTLPPSVNLIKQSVDPNTRPRKQPKPTSKLKHPSKLTDSDLTPDTFEIYLKNFINLNPQSHISILSLKLNSSLRLLARMFYAKRDRITKDKGQSSTESKYSKLDRLYTQSLSNLIRKGELIVYESTPFDTSSIDSSNPPSPDDDDPSETDFSGLYEHYKSPSGPLLQDVLIDVMSTLKYQASLEIIHKQVTRYQENLSTLSLDSIQIGLDWLIQKDYTQVIRVKDKADKYKLTLY